MDIPSISTFVFPRNSSTFFLPPNLLATKIQKPTNLNCLFHSKVNFLTFTIDRIWLLLFLKVFYLLNHKLVIGLIQE